MIYLPALVSVSVYFEKRRSLATGISVCGSGVGLIIFGPFSLFLLRLPMNGWRGGLWVLSGIVALNAVFGLLLKPLPSPKGKEESSPNNGESPQDAENNANPSETHANGGTTKDEKRVLLSELSELSEHAEPESHNSKHDGLPAVRVTVTESADESNENLMRPRTETNGTNETKDTKDTATSGVSTQTGNSIALELVKLRGSGENVTQHTQQHQQTPTKLRLKASDDAHSRGSS